MHGINVTLDADTGIATLLMKMEGRANKMNLDFGAGFTAAVEALEGMEGLKGIIVATGHKDFCVGADIDFLYETRDPVAFDDAVKRSHGLFRRLETLGVPVVAALTGSALGGGCEIALACHHRIALNNPRIMVGLPETLLGVIPGGGGTQRLPRLIGIQAALEIMAQGKSLRAPKALKAGLVSELAEDADDLKAKAVAWIEANQGYKQPWDKKGFKWPAGVQPRTREARQLFIGAASMITKKTAGAFLAPEAVIKAVFEGGQVASFDAALAVERRHFVRLTTGDQCKDMVRTFWYHKNAVEKGEGLPKIEDARIKTVGVLGAGMMGAGLAFVAAKRGYDVVLKDISQEALDRGIAHCQKGVAKYSRHASDEEKAAIIGRIKPTLENGDLSECDLIIEAVFENIDLKHRVIAETEAVLKPDAIFASNTSALPINDLATASKNTANFIGMHFFSPVEQMPLLEVIAGEGTSDDTLARVLAFGRDIRKTNVVVNDGYGFFTSRFFSAYIMEAVELVAQGHAPALVEYAARHAGMVVSPLKVFDEVNLKLAMHGMAMREKYVGKLDAAGLRLMKKMVELGRTGKTEEQGFYDWSVKPRKLWDGLTGLAEGTPAKSDLKYVADRLMLVQVNEAAKCLETGILRTTRDGEIAAIMGVGFAPQSGGPFAWMDRYGIRNVVNALDGLQRELKNDHYAPANLLREMAEKNERFFPEPSEG